MLTFKDYTYTRPDMEKLEKEFNILLQQFSEAESVEQQNRIIADINKLRSHFDSMQTLVSIRYTVDTTDAFYAGEQNFMDEVSPIYSGMITRYYDQLLLSKFKLELEQKWGSQLFKIIELQTKTFKPEIIEHLQTENKLISQYSKLKASARIMFDGEERNLAQMEPFSMSVDRNVRIAATSAVTAFYQQNEAEFDQIFDQLVKVRHNMALELGYENYVQLGYDRLTRSDYDKDMVANYRKQVYESMVPVASKLKARQARRLKLADVDMKYYDESLLFLTGNPTPQGDPEFIINNGKQMYKELSPETDEFFNFMVQHELLDLVAKKGKDSGGYCTYISEYESPFIFSNFNGTAGDVDVLTHEAGHAFQGYQSRSFELPEYNWPTLEACEIHSMSMEFFAWPWMKNFFLHDEAKYKFTHLSDALMFIPYGVTVDEFQHWIYENPNATPEERKAAWRRTEKKYLPHRDYADNTFLEKGCFWFRQGHIYSSPFYYIDYTLAQVCAFQFWNKANENRTQAWADYVKLCNAGGSKSFLELVELAGLSNPFVNGTIQKTIDPIEAWLDKIDDSKL